MAASATLPAAPKPPSGTRRAVVLVATALLLSVLGGGAFWWLRAAPALARYLPKDTQLYAEFPSITKALIGLAGVDSIDDKDLDAERQKKRVVEAFADSFDLGVGNVERFFDGARSLAVAGRVDRGGEVVVLLEFSSRADVAPVLASGRFKKEDSFKGFERYRLERREIDNPDLLAKIGPLERAFDQLGDRKPLDDKPLDDKLDKPKSTVAMLWCEDEKLLAIGTTAMIEDVARVVTGEHASLEGGNELFKRADWPLRSSLLVYVDPNLIEARELREEYLDGVRPLTGALRFIDEGILASVRFELRGKEVPPPTLFTTPTKLSLYERLPSDTIGYVAFSTRFAGSGRDVERSLYEAAASLDVSSERELQKALDAARDQSEIDLAALIEISGDQAIIGVVADDRALKAVAEGDQSELTVVAIAEIRDRKRAATLVRDVQDFMELGYDVSRKEGGFIAERDKKATVSVTLEADGNLLIARGKKSAIEDIEDVYRGKGRSLKKDEAHEKALAALRGRPQAFAWVDAGRVADVLLSRKTSADPAGEPTTVRATLRELEVPIDALDFEGASRFTAWAGLFVDASPGALSVEIRSLNGVTLAALWALLEAKREGMFSTLKISETGIPECDAYIATLRKCIATSSASQKATLQSLLKTTVDMYKDMPSSARAGQGEGCAQAEKTVKEVFDCK